MNIEDELKQAIKKIGIFDDAGTRTQLINFAQEELQKVSPFRRQPISNVIWVPSDTVEPNDYNPNAVAPPEMRLLYRSIQEDGFTQPIVVSWDTDREKYIIIDGFHRSIIGKEKADINRKLKGFLPIVILNKDINDRMASTIRHNRAKGKHTIDKMSDLVMNLIDNNWSDEEIANHLGMVPDEVLRLKQFTGLPSMFKDTDFSKSWV